MSGISRATVESSLGRTLAEVRRGVEECAQTAASTTAIGRKDFDAMRQTSATAKRDVKRQFPMELEPFLGGETGHWKSLLERFDKTFADAEGAARKADEHETEFRTAKVGSDRSLREIDDGVRSIQGALSTKMYFCDPEFAEAKALRARAREVLARMKKDVQLARTAQSLRQKSYADYSAAVELATEAQREYERVLALAKDRKVTEERIREEKRRKATLLNAAVKSLRASIEAKDYVKFGDGSYSPDLQRELDSIPGLIEGNEIDQAIQRAEEAKLRLEQTLKKIDSAQQAWKKAKTAAERSLADARVEAGKMNREEMRRFSKCPAEEIDRCFKAFDDAEREISQESFDVASEGIAKSLRHLREINDATIENKRLFVRRQEVAEAIMQVLYDSAYDKPCYYGADARDELSDLVVVAAAPGDVGNMKMSITLDGEVTFDQQNVPEGKEKVCRDAIRTLQEKLGQEGLRFDISDWGRAGNEGVSVDLRPPAPGQVREIQRQG